MMNWYWYLATHAGVIYAAVGLYLGLMWYWINPQEKNIGKAESCAGTFIVVFVWPFVLEPMDKEHLNRKKKTIESGARRKELRRMRAEEIKEEAAIAMLEANADHRERMDALAERRRRVEERA